MTAKTPRPDVVASMQTDSVEALRDYFLRSQNGMPQSDETRSAMALYQKTRRSLYPDVKVRERATRRLRAAKMSKAEKERKRVALNAKRRAHYAERKGSPVGRYTRRKP